MCPFKLGRLLPSWCIASSLYRFCFVIEITTHTFLRCWTFSGKIWHKCWFLPWLLDQVNNKTGSSHGPWSWSACWSAFAPTAAATENIFIAEYFIIACFTCSHRHGLFQHLLFIVHCQRFGFAAREAFPAVYLPTSLPSCSPCLSSTTGPRLCGHREHRFHQSVPYNTQGVHL